MSQSPPLVAVVVADEEDLDSVHEALELLRACSVPHEVIVASTQLLPDPLREWAASSRDRGLQVILAVAGRDPHLPFAIAAQTILPVIALPLPTVNPVSPSSALRDSGVRAHEGLPFATTGADSPVNAALFAVQILARFDARWEGSLLKYRAHLRERFREQAETIRLRYEPTGRTDGPSPASESESESESEELAYLRHLESRFVETASPSPRPFGKAIPETPGAASAVPTARPAPEVLHTDKPALKREARHVGRIKVDPEMMPVEVAESATDCLLDGGIVALPTDTVYGLAVDATNPDAVNALCELKGRDANRPIAIFIESQRQLAALVRNLSPEVRQMLEAFWPGPLTVVFERRGQDFDYLSPGSTIGVRLPDHSIALALLQELRRPIACSSANPSGAPSARSADEVEAYFGEDVHMIIDAGKLPPVAASTVIDVTRAPFRILRQGPITRDQLAAVLGDLLESEDAG